MQVENADFRFANLSNADLSRAVMGGSNLRRANVKNTDFSGVELATVSMEYANFSEAKNADIPSYKMHLR